MAAVPLTGQPLTGAPASAGTHEHQLPIDPPFAPPRVALYGGSFNPPHVGHVAAVAQLLATAEVDAVWLLVCSSHAFGKDLAPLEQRVAWCTAAFDVFAPGRVVISTAESTLPQPARTVDTLEHLRAQFPGTRFDFAVGADVLGERHAWKAWDRIEATTRLHVLGRQGFAVPQGYRASPPLPPVSSTLIRNRLRAGLSVDGLVPSRVLPLLSHGTDAPPKTLLLGAGRLGGALGRALESIGWPLTTWRRGLPRPSEEQLAEFELVILAVSDSAIAEVASWVTRPHHRVLHLSGAEPAQCLRAGPAASVAACHPLQSFGPEAPIERFQAIYWGLEGDDTACDAGAQLAEALGGHTFRVSGPTEKLLYHAACCVISNGLVALADRAEALMVASGVEEGLHALAPLAEGTAHNLRVATTAPSVLTGPIARGDAATVAAHRAAIRARLPAALEPYDALCHEIARTAGRRTASTSRNEGA